VVVPSNPRPLEARFPQRVHDDPRPTPSGFRPAVRPLARPAAPSAAAAPAPPAPRPARTPVDVSLPLAGAPADALDFDDVDTAVETVSSMLLARAAGGEAVVDGEAPPAPAVFASDPPSAARFASGIVALAPVEAPRATSDLEAISAAATAKMQAMSPLSAMAISVPEPPPLPSFPPKAPPPPPGAAARQLVHHLPPSSVRRAFIASLRPEPPPPPAIRPWFVVAATALAVLVIGAAAIAALAFPGLFH
jgi:hypothetical protein